MADTLPTTEPFTTTVYGLGTSNSARKGFQQTADALPAAADVWGEYFDNVMRGDTDSLSGAPETVKASRTFLDASPTGDAPAIITPTHVGSTNVGALGGGAPDGGFVPTTASPGEGNGTNPFTIPALNGVVVAKLQAIGSATVAGEGENGSCHNPQYSAQCQTKQDSRQTGPSPNYNLHGPAPGEGAWSGA